MLRRAMTQAYKFEEITARELKASLYELDGISRATIEAHYKLYEGYVNKRNEILGKLDGIDVSSANQVYSELRGLKVELSFAVGGIKNHELYFEHLGGGGGDPDGLVGDLIKRDFGAIGALVWIATFLLFRYASLASILATASLPVLAVLLGEPWPVIAFGALAAIAVVLLHRANIGRLRAGTESRFRFGREAT